jgi:hypothetical protein
MKKHIDLMTQILQKIIFEIASLRVPKRRSEKIRIPRKEILAML